MIFYGSGTRIMGLINIDGNFFYEINNNNN